jgi:hypothetical protein
MAIRKRTTVKTGPHTTRTITHSLKGTRVTYSNKPPGAKTRRTVSTNLVTGKVRTTHTTSQGGGWLSSRSKTFTPVSKGRGQGSSRSGSGGGNWVLWIICILILFSFL